MHSNYYDTNRHINSGFVLVWLGLIAFWGVAGVVLHHMGVI